MGSLEERRSLWGQRLPGIFPQLSMADFSSEWSKISKKKQSAEGASFPFNLVPVLPGEGEGPGRERVLK